MATSQVSAAQWQSFEMRMRQRRAARLVIRAKAALEQGLVADAAAALEEAQGLDSSTPELAILMAAVPSPAPAVDLPLVAETPFEEPIVVTHAEPRRTGWIGVAASLAVIASLLAWGAVRFSPRLVPSTTSPATSTELSPAPRPGPIPEQPIAAATTGRADAAAAPTVALSARTTDVEKVEAPVVEDPAAAHRVVADDSTAHDPEPAVVPALRPAATAESPSSLASSTPEAPRPEPVRELPAGERDVVALAEVALPPPAPVAAPASEFSVPAPVVAPPVAPEPAEPPRVDDTPLVRRVLSQYESAYSSLDVSAAKRVWPSVDTFALARAFDGLALQRISLGDCRVSLNGSSARANCRGLAQWTPKIGGGTRSGSRSWSFDLRKNDGQWRIVDVTTR